MYRILCLILFLAFTFDTLAQKKGSIEVPSPKGAFLRSLAVPGWGHYYVDKKNWIRGQYHLGADVVLVLSYLGLNIHSDNLRESWFGYTQNQAGIDIRNRNRSLRLAVGDFNSLQEYNDFLARSRNWDQFIEDTPPNRWNWPNDAAREEYNDIRSRFERIDQQLPAILGLMIVNRVAAAISAYNRAKAIRPSSAAVFYFRQVHGKGFLAHLKIGF